MRMIIRRPRRDVTFATWVEQRARERPSKPSVLGCSRRFLGGFCLGIGGLSGLGAGGVDRLRLLTAADRTLHAGQLGLDVGLRGQRGELAVDVVGSAERDLVLESAGCD